MWTFSAVRVVIRTHIIKIIYSTRYHSHWGPTTHIKIYITHSHTTMRGWECRCQCVPAHAFLFLYNTLFKYHSQNPLLKRLKEGQRLGGSVAAAELLKLLVLFNLIYNFHFHTTLILLLLYKI